MRNLNPLIEEAVSNIKVIKAETRGRKRKLTLKHKVEILLIKRLIEKSNREMSNMLVLFSLQLVLEVHTLGVKSQRECTEERRENQIDDHEDL